MRLKGRPLAVSMVGWRIDFLLLVGTDPFPNGNKHFSRMGGD